MSHDRQKYLDAIKQQLEPNIVNHSMALEACMGGIYDHLQAVGQLDAAELPKDDWLLAGLIHDIDFGGEFKDQHPHKTTEALAKYGLTISPAVLELVRSHAARECVITLQSKAQWAIYCADSLTGLITAVAFVYPSKKLADVKLSSVVKRFLKEPRFAAGTRRDEVALCAKADGLNIPLDKFIEICLVSMQKIGGELGL
ncbi:MAG: HDIG protein [uncultured bacterium]|nr:MAG: HDIG protein [uncultured bacterium]HLD45685.1 hypothetical protein [bacterium]